MPTLKSRINISLPDEVREILERLAKRDCVPEATKAARLLEIAIEMEEDLSWNKIAEARDKKQTKFISHSSAWK
jgi:predicted DNA-binding protein